MVNISNSIFFNNSAIKATLFTIKNDGVLKCSNWTIHNNFAVDDGVLIAETNGRFEFYNSKIFNNYAIQSPIGTILVSDKASIIDGTEIYRNDRIIQKVLNQNLVEWSLLCFLGEKVLERVREIDLNSLIHYESTIQVLFGALEVRNSWNICKQNSFINSFSSNISISDSEIHDVRIK